MRPHDRRGLSGKRNDHSRTAPRFIQRALKRWVLLRELEIGGNGCAGLRRSSQGLAGFENWVMIIGMGIASFLITLQVVLRYVFNYSLSWGEEVTRYAIVWMSFVGAGMGIRKGAHICVDLLYVFFSRAVEERIDLPDGHRGSGIWDGDPCDRMQAGL